MCLSYTDSKSTSYTICILRQYTCVHAVKGWFTCIKTTEELIIWD